MSGPKFLFVRFSAIGDCVMALPAVTAVRQAIPGAFIAWAVDSRCAPVIDTRRLVDHVQEFPRDRWKRESWSVATWRDQVRHYLLLRRFRFDFGIDLQGHSKTALCLRLASPKRSVSVPATDVFARILNRPCRTEIGALHTVEAHLAVLGELGDFPAPSGPILPDLTREREAVLPRLPQDPFATLSTGAGAPNKLYPPALWSQVGARLQSAGVSVVWTGGPGDAVPELPGATSLVGALTLRESMAAIAGSAVHLSGDTGSGHLAAAYGVPTVTVFGPMDPARYRPYTHRGTVLREGGDPANVRPEAIAAAALAFLEEDGSLPR
ncbi:MAG: glycosyltransferase family 9 protein [Fimbriimonadaceae bacterium]|nr:glycosyltransferase family 9 protein [Fimbriimonadaceae bacterium]